MRTLLTLLTIFLLSGCNSVDVAQYATNRPQLDLFSYFTGKTKGYGIVQNRKGVQTRYFIVDITGTIEADGSLKLYEEFDWSDGEQPTRTWMINKSSEHNYSGTAGDVVGTAEGSAYGNALNWEYHLNLKVEDSTWEIKFDDWMFLITEQILINRARMSKFGFTVGEITIVFQK